MMDPGGFSVGGKEKHDGSLKMNFRGVSEWGERRNMMDP